MPAPRQLDIFNRHYRGVKAPPALEFKLHCLVADTLNRWSNPGWRWTHLPFGEWRTYATGVRLKRMGVRPGWPDFMFVSEDGRVCFLELKRRGGVLSAAQQEIKQHIKRAGLGYCITSDFAEAVAWLKAAGILRSGITPQ